MKGTHEYRDDERNATILIDINGTLYPRDKARVSVFEGGFLLGDGVWGKYWYGSVWKSTGFSEHQNKPLKLLPEFQAISNAALTYYLKLYELRLIV